MPIVLGGKRYRLGRRFVHRLVAVVALLGLAAFGSALRQALHVHQRVEQVRQQLQDQRRRNAELERALAEATSPRAIERRARSTMGWVLPGERVFHPAIPVAPDDPYRVPRRSDAPPELGG